MITESKKGRAGRSSFKKVLILGSGGLKIGQAGEFDYSGSQAIKALREEGIYTVLVNPNIATVQTDGDMADRVYFQPLNISIVNKIIAREKPDAIALSFGGQTALNLGLELHEQGILAKFGIKVLGTPVSAIKITEDRQLFKKALSEIGVKTALSQAAYSVEQASRAAKKIGYPVMMRSGYSLGGLGSGKIKSQAELQKKVRQVLRVVPQVLIEEYLDGWKEIEYEVVRDASGSVIAVCNMENFDPMGIHTGESIVVAPSQTLTNSEYHQLRETALKTIEHLGIIGECNIQFALNPSNGDYRVIEVNARLSRSSALASKATGYPLAFVAMKLALGYLLHEIKNSVTGSTPAFYEPALDYIAVKIPRWDLVKLKTSDRSIGSEMKSVGEVMALARSFGEALQKAVRMLNIGADGLSIHPYEFKDPMEEISEPTDRRLFAIYQALQNGTDVDKIHSASQIDKWFLAQIEVIKNLETDLSQKPLGRELLLDAKKKGFSDKTIALLCGTSEEKIRQKRIKAKILPVVKQIDTLAGEFDARTNYLYLTYSGTENDVGPLPGKPIMTLGSGPYCIGSSVEFDWCAVNCVKTLRKYQKATIMINSNPETVSTDYDRSDRLYFEELTLERTRDITDFEKPAGTIVSVGGQIANNLALPLAQRGYTILGTSATSIDKAEDRQKFSSMLNRLKIDQPIWQEVSSLARAKTFVSQIGYPVLIRPSYVLSGGAMNVVSDEAELKKYLLEAAALSPDHPVVISQFISGAKELEIDGVAAAGKIQIYAITEHLENAGVHSGDATVVLPPQRLYLETIRRAKQITRAIVGELNLTGPFNIQFIAKDNEIKVIECNVRASRSFPFVSKMTNYNFIEIATEAILGINKKADYHTIDLDYVGVKSPQFSYNRLKGADPVAGVEMASTGEVACLGDDMLEAFYNSWQATEQTITGKNIFLSVADEQKYKFVDECLALYERGWRFYATPGTHDFLKDHGIKSEIIYKISDKTEPSIPSGIVGKKFELMINLPSSSETSPDAYTIRRLAIDNHLPLITNAELARTLLQSLVESKTLEPEPKSWQEFMAGKYQPTSPSSAAQKLL
ncbi:carbamoyl-phosphate synthase (glutamine-hydrolyzing) large subunit [Candidatus Saccharibacteria bacterium]|nr:carbamoyl-phosphate synthase (glutamine-hydrolyzing) large subunit [Candidatus Saccharibacteria bacterium]